MSPHSATSLFTDGWTGCLDLTGVRVSQGFWQQLVITLFVWMNNFNGMLTLDEKMQFTMSNVINTNILHISTKQLYVRTDRHV